MEKDVQQPQQIPQTSEILQEQSPQSQKKRFSKPLIILIIIAGLVGGYFILTKFIFNLWPSDRAALFQNGRITCSERITQTPQDRQLGKTDSQIFSYNKDGDDRKQLTSSGFNIMPSWSYDGKRIFFSSNMGKGNTQEIWMMNVDGSNKRQLTFNTLGGNFTPEESPDGRHIAFSSARNGRKPEVWIMNTNGSNQHMLASVSILPEQENIWALHPTWSADGKKIAYASTESGSTQIWVINIDGSNKIQLTSSLGFQYPDANVPNWSLDGRLITFWSGLERNYGEIWIMNSDGSNPKRLTDTPDPSNSDDPMWSPDGSKIIFGRGRAGDRAMYIIDVSNKQVTHFTDGVHWCDWQPIPI